MTRIALTLAFFLMIPAAGLSATWTVGTSGEDYTTIQAAISAGTTVNGDTVLVSPGTYDENINFWGKNIIVTSSGGPTVTTIRGTGNDSVVRFEYSETLAAVLEGFSITNGVGWHGGGIICDRAGPTIRDNYIYGNRTADYDLNWGGGIYCRESWRHFRGRSYRQHLWAQSPHGPCNTELRF